MRTLGRAPPATAVSVIGNVADNRKTFSVRVHEALYRAVDRSLQRRFLIDIILFQSGNICHKVVKGRS